MRKTKLEKAQEAFRARKKAVEYADRVRKVALASVVGPPDSTPEAMLKRLKKSLKDPYPRPWRGTHDKPGGRLQRKLMRVRNARWESLFVMPTSLARLIVKAVNAQHEAKQEYERNFKRRKR